VFQSGWCIRIDRWPTRIYQQQAPSHRAGVRRRTSAGSAGMRNLVARPTARRIRRPAIGQRHAPESQSAPSRTRAQCVDSTGNISKLFYGNDT